MVYRKKETRIKFNYLRKRHNISPRNNVGISGEDHKGNMNLLEMIREKGSATTVTIEKILPNIHSSGSMTDIYESTDQSQTLNSSFSH